MASENHIPRTEDELRALLQENERERKVLESQLTQSQKEEVRTVCQLQRSASRIDERHVFLENRRVGVQRSGDLARKQVVLHAERLHASVDRRKESLLLELDRYQVEKEQLLEKQKEELASLQRELRNLEQQVNASADLHPYLEKLERILFLPIVTADLTLELEENKLTYVVEHMGSVSPTSHTGVSPLGLNTRTRSIVLEQKVAAQLPVEVKQQIMFWSGFSAGMISATSTHWLDVIKVLRQLGLQRPTSFRGYFVGLPMGAFAQGQRFGVTLLLNSVMQQRMHNLAQLEPGTARYRVQSFCLSVVAAGLGEALANPPVVLKNWQISQTVSAREGFASLWKRGKIPVFFRGVVPGMIRKGLANAIVLQSIQPTKSYLESVARDLCGSDTSHPSSKALFGFAAGSITGCAAEVLTNHPDRVKTLMQTKQVTVLQAISEANRDPFRGSFWAGLRKGAIRGVNWGSLGVFTSLLEEAYKSRYLAAD